MTGKILRRATLLAQAWQLCLRMFRTALQITAADRCCGGLDLTVSPGRSADGLLAYLDAGPDVHRLATYLAPPIATPPATPAGTAGTRDAVVLEVWREEINGFQIPDTPD